MSSQTSFAALQWLNYINDYCPDLINKDGKRIELEHHYHRGEKSINGYFVDGFAEVDGKEHFYEFNGCRYNFFVHDIKSCFFFLDFINALIAILNAKAVIE